MPETRSWTAGLPFSKGENVFGRLSMIGGTLELAGQSVTFSPAMRIGPKRSVPVADITEVAAAGDHPPRLKIRTRGDDELVLIVVDRSMQTPAAGDAHARDEAVAAITAAGRGSDG